MGGANNNQNNSGFNMVLLEVTMFPFMLKTPAAQLVEGTQRYFLTDLAKKGKYHSVISTNPRLCNHCH